MSERDKMDRRARMFVLLRQADRATEVTERVRRTHARYLDDATSQLIQQQCMASLCQDARLVKQSDRKRSVRQMLSRRVSPGGQTTPSRAAVVPLRPAKPSSS